MAYQIADGASFAPEGKKNFVVKPGEFVFAAADLEHGHIHGMVNGLLEAGATLKYVWDDDPDKVAEFVKKHPDVIVADSFDRILDDPEVKMVAAAGILTGEAILLLLAMGDMVVETASVVLQVVYFKISKGKRLFRMAPLHHHFEKRGWSEERVVAVFSFAALFFAALALVLR